MASSGTITIASNWGAPTPVTKTSITTMARSVTIPMTDTTGIEVGMQVTGPGSPLTTATAVYFTDTTDLVTLYNHGLSANDEVSFVTVPAGTGIVTFTIYYVIYVSSSTFQLAATPDGPALPFTTNGSGTLWHRTEVASITPNTSVTMTRPMAASGTSTLLFQQLKTGTAVLKGWLVSQ